MSTTNREKRKRVKMKVRERKKNGPKSLRSRQYARSGTVGDGVPDALNLPPPEDGMRLRLMVEDPQGLSCDTAKWPLRMLCQMDASVWVVHDEAGSIHLTDRGG